MKNVTLKFCGKGESATDATDHFLPVMMFDCPSNFSTVEYFEVSKITVFINFNVYNGNIQTVSSRSETKKILNFFFRKTLKIFFNR